MRGCKQSLRPFFRFRVHPLLLALLSLCKTASSAPATRFSSTACSLSCGDNVEANGLWTPRDPPPRCMSQRKTEPRTRSPLRYTIYDSYTAFSCADHHQPIVQHQGCVIGQIATLNKTTADPRGKHMGQRSHCVRWREGEAQTKGAIDLTTSLC